MSTGARSKAGPGAPSSPSLSSLPDDLLLRCLQPLSQEERFRCVALVSKRFQQLCLAPQLLRRLTVSISGGASVLPRTEALLQFSMQHAAHVRHLGLDIDPAGAQPDGQHQELAALVASSLTAFSAAGSLQRLSITGRTPLVSTAWLPALQQLEYLDFGSAERSLRLPAAMSRLTALKTAALAGSPLVLEGPLPPGLTRLCIENYKSTALLRQVSQLSALVWLQLKGGQYTSPSMACLSAVTTLRRLECQFTTSGLPASLPAMTWLESLGCIPKSFAPHEEAAAWNGALRAALPRLTRLTTLQLGFSELDLAAVAQLPRLQRLCLWTSALPDSSALSGPCLASLRWLGLPWDFLEPAVQALRAASRLEYVCALDMPACSDQERWRAAWDFLATHPPLRRFRIEITESETPSLAVLDAVIQLHSRRPALHVRRTTFGATTGFHLDLLDAPDLPPLPY